MSRNSVPLRSNPPVFAATGKTLPAGIQNTAFLIDKLAAECPPVQFIREFTANGIDAITALPEPRGQITWDLDWSRYDATGVPKLVCIDTGIGMTPAEMIRYLKDLSSSRHEQSVCGNFGIGAKISALTRNRCGLTYMSWKDGEGSMIQMHFDEETQAYGLRRWQENGGEFWAPVSEAAKPERIGEHGTMVIFEGNLYEEDTMAAPAGVPMPARWIMRYLNTRYFRFPSGVEVRALEGRFSDSGKEENKRFMRRVEGQQVWLDRHAQSSGVVQLADARAHWWILKVDVDRNSGHFAAGGHMAALFQDELYEMCIGRTAIARLQSFGVIFGTDRVVLYLQPNTGPGTTVQANAARTLLMSRAQPLDWVGWACAFREAMPPALMELQHEVGGLPGERDYRKFITQRLKQCVDLFQFKRYKPSPFGTELVNPGEVRNQEVADEIAEVDFGIVNRAPSGRQRTLAPVRSGANTHYLEGLIKPGTQRADQVPDFRQPDVHWVSEADGTRSQQDMADRAAKYLTTQNVLLINADFRVIAGMVSRWQGQYAHIPGADRAVVDAVREWYEQQLVEVVLSAQSLRLTGGWSEQELADLLSEDSLTTAVLARWSIDTLVKRSLGFRLGADKAVM
jgi:hypothetical protein